MLRPFALEEPTTVAEASALLARYGESARLYAGGTELLLVMKEGLVHYDRLVNLKTIPGLRGIRYEGGRLRIGATTTHRALETSPVVREHFPAIAEMAHDVANVRVREVGTLGGNLCFAEPHADPGTLLLVFGARVRAERASGARRIPLEAFFTAPYTTALEPDEVLTEVEVPALPPRSAAVYRKFGILERPSVGVAVALTLSADGAGFDDVRIAVGCVGPVPRRMPEAERLLKGCGVEEALARLGEAGAAAGRAAEAISDLHGSADYKAHLVGVLLARAVRQAYRSLTDGRGQ
ncbi:MAG TPA: xanthine dehydrogenase family protein subunit M [Thermodesulfobacteriota bacterium]|nr:xanthine dehydrogenase family protein subunit M [Thermodesulfobacteriota bacterium]